MLYLSQLLQKDLKYGNKSYGKVIDFAVSEDKAPFVTKVLIKYGREKFGIPSEALHIENDILVLKTVSIIKLPYEEEKDFYLAEDLLDKQVIDINGRRLVRVNDVILKQNGALKIDGIDIGLSGVLRRLGLDFVSLKTITLPWSLIEAFDYQTGNIQIKLTQSKLNTFHPAEVAEMLEEAGAKERVGLVQALDAKQAAFAIERTDEETQTAILEQVPSTTLKHILARMKSSAIADIIERLNPFTSKKIYNTLESEKAKKVRKLLVFEDDEAGGLMDFTFYKENIDSKIGETLKNLSKKDARPEIIIVVDNDGKLCGAIHIKKLVNNNLQTKLRDLLKHKYYVYENATFNQIFRLFAEYTLRVLPVVDRDMVVIGIITLESILEKIQDEEEREDAL